MKWDMTFTVSVVLNMDNKGYTQAIENLAYAIRELTTETLDPIFEANPWLEETDEDTADAFVDKHMPQEHTDKWLYVEVIVRTVADTYNRPVSEIEKAVNALLLLKELQNLHKNG